jgi:hypothetical protein
MTGYRWLLGFALALAVVAVPAPVAARPAAQSLALIRFVHAIPNAPPMDVWVDGYQYVVHLDYSEATRHDFQWTDFSEVDFVPAGAPPTAAVLRIPISPLPGQAYTVMATGLLPAPVPLVLPDDDIGPPGPVARMRALDASVNTPPMDLGVVGGPALFVNLNVGQPTPYIDMPAGVANLALRWTGTPVVAVPMPEFMLTPGGTYTIAVIGIVNGVPPLFALVLYDP